MNVRFYWLLAAVASLLFSACVKKSKDPNVFRYPIETEPPTLDWSIMEDHVNFDVLSNVHHGLVKYDRELKIIPSLSEKWEISPDGKTYTFHLRDSKWSDGVPVRAQDFVYSWRRTLEPKRASSYAYILYDVENAEAFNTSKISDFAQVGAKALDDKTFQVKLKNAASYFIHIAAFQVTYPMRQDIVDAHPTDFTEPKYLRTTGPYRMTEWAHDSRLTLEVNPYYWGEKPKIPKVQYLVVKEDSTALNMFNRGELDVCSRLPSLELDRLKKTPEYRSLPNLRMYYYGMNTAKKPFDNVLVRKAFSHALDRRAIVTILKGDKKAMTSWIPQGLLGYNPAIGLAFDPPLAKKYLAQAGYPEGKNFPPITLEYDSIEMNKLVAEKVQFMLKSVLNISQVELLPQELKVHLDQVKTGTPHFFRLGWGADYPDPETFINLFTSYSGNNDTRWKNKAYDDLVAEGRRVIDPKKRAEIYDRAQRLLVETEVPILPLFQDTVEYLVHARVQNFTIDALEAPRISETSLALEK